MNFDWFLNPIKNKYADFTGRATVQEFWMFVLFYVLIYIAILIVGGIVGLGSTLALLFALVLIVPSCAMTARRLHDTNMSGWWQLIGFIPFLGLIIMIILTIRQGMDGDNSYGPDPRSGMTSREATPVVENVVHDVEPEPDSEDN